MLISETDRVDGSPDDVPVKLVSQLLHLSQSQVGLCYHSLCRHQTHVTQPHTATAQMINSLQFLVSFMYLARFGESGSTLASIKSVQVRKNI